MHVSAYLLAAAIATAPLAAQDWSRATHQTVALSSFNFTPRTLHLKAGQPVVLHLVNRSSSGHDFTAPAFFAAATVRPADAAWIKKGSIEVPSRQRRDIVLIPRAGTYRLKCDHSFHKLLGMKGRIIVD